MTESSANDAVREEVEYQRLTDFLENTPPNQLVYVSDLAISKQGINIVYSAFKAPEIQLHCNHEACNGIRFFRCVKGSDERLYPDRFEFFYVTYRCSNCQQIEKSFSIAAVLEIKKGFKGRVYKFGELPPFGPPVSPKLIKLIGPDREEFLKGRRCENQGLGIGAFIYYRRVIENQKNRIIEQIIKVSKKIGAPPDKIDKLQNAINETQFSKALEIAKDSMPESLLINGHSPILLLHKALSEGVHALTDENCLKLASSVRIVLGELSERLSQALKDEAELAKALSTLMQKK